VQEGQEAEKGQVCEEEEEEEMRRGLTGALLIAVFALAAPGTAFASDLFVDKDTGHDVTPSVNDCLNQASPCQTIGYALSLTSSGDTVKVDDTVGAYAEILGLDDGRSLVGFEFVGGDEGGGVEPGDVDIEPPAGSSAIFLSGTAGTISGLRLRTSGSGKGIQGAGGNVTAITGNTFDTTTDGFGVSLASGATTTLVSGNVFKSASATGDDAGVGVVGHAATIEDNTFNTLHTPIVIGTGAANSIVRRNTITGVQALPTAGTGIDVRDSTGVEIEDNELSSPTGANSFGIEVRSTGATTSATLRRNQVYGHANGLLVSDTTSLTMNGDVIGGSTNFGLIANDTAAAGSGDVNAKNVTIVGATGTDVQLSDDTLTVDAGIVGNAIGTTGAATCVLSNSRGPTTSGTPCQSFTFSNPVSFVNTGANNYHLSPLPLNPNLIDGGGSSLPAAPDDIDYDGQKRAMDGNGDCSELTDIGADEVLPVAPTASFTSGPAEGATITTASDSFGFSSTDPCVQAFECSLDAASFTSCSSPLALGPLANGPHALHLRALDLVPNPGSAVTRNFTVAVPAPPPPVVTPVTPAPPVTPKKCKKGKKLKKGKCVKKKRRKK
jgi:hypothetical protein